MADNDYVQVWEESQEYELDLSDSGKIIDFLEPEKERPNKAEERVRQRIARVLHFEYGYPKELMCFEAPIRMGRDLRHADIAIYASPAARVQKDQGKILLVCEVKAPEIKECDGQLVSYVSASSAEGGLWTNGTQVVYVHKDAVAGKIQGYLGSPRYGEAWDSIGRLDKYSLSTPVDLKLVFKRCHNELYKDGAYSEDIALDMVRIILAKIEDECSSSERCEFYITPSEFGSAEGRKAACRRVRTLFSSVKAKYPEVFSESEEINASDKTLAIVISSLQMYSLLDAPYDVIGTAYETYVASHLKGERGQYFTNRLVIDMMVDMVDPRPGQVVLDPACGSGGFLIASMNHALEEIEAMSISSMAKEKKKGEVASSLYGVDVTKKLVKVAKANMMLGHDGHGGIIHHDSLSDFESFPALFSERAGEGKPHFILTNPPFGAGHDTRIKDSAVLSHFKIGHVWQVTENGEVQYSDALNTNQGVAPELLFLERCIQWVADGGVVGIVMAKGQLDNKEALAARTLLLDSCRILAVVNLHEDTFEPFCGSKASVIIAQKGAHPDAYPVFMAISNKIGQTSRGVPVFKRDDQGRYILENGERVLDEDLSDIVLAYRAFRKGELKETAFRFSVSSTQFLQGSFSLNPVQYLPAHSDAQKRVLELGETDDFELRRIGDIATRVFNGPRFVRPYAEEGVVEGPGIVKYFTGTAITQIKAENVKYLDRNKATPLQNRQLDELTVHKGYIVVSDSGTIGRVDYLRAQHDGCVATNNLIRIVIEDEFLRGFVYQYLRGPIGQKLLKKNVYGTNQEHLEPYMVADILVPVPKDRRIVEDIGGMVIRGIESLEECARCETGASALMDQLVTGQ